jgi:hypothetical protein
LYALHGLLFYPTQKDNKDMQVNALRMAMAERRVIIHPRCKTLINHLKYATWDKSRKTFTRSTDGAHYDAVDALIYLLRNIDKNRNPYPSGFRRGLNGSRDDWFTRESDNLEDKYSDFKNLFIPKKSRN